MLFFKGKEGKKVAPVTDGISADSRVSVTSVTPINC